MPLIKTRAMFQLCLRTGEVSKSYVNVPCTLQRYVKAINDLNKSANVYGVVYLPDDECEEYARWSREV